MLNLHRTTFETQYTYTTTTDSSTINSTSLIFTSRVTMTSRDLNTDASQVAVRHEPHAPVLSTPGNIENEGIELFEIHVPHPRVGQKINDAV